MSKRFHKEFESEFGAACKNMKQALEQTYNEEVELIENRASGANWTALNDEWKCASGLHALENARIMLEEYLKQPKEFLKRFSKFQNWCDWTNTLRTSRFAEKFALGFLHAQFDKLIAIDKIQPIQESLLDNAIEKLRNISSG